MTLWKRATVCVLCSAAFLWGAGGPGAAELPAPIAEALAGDEPGFMARIQWDAVRTHPVVVAALELESANGSVGSRPPMMVINQLLGRLEGLGLDPGIVEEAWWFQGVGGSGLWFWSSFEGEALDDALHEAGWSVDAGFEGRNVLVRNQDGKTEEWQQSMLDQIEDDEEQAEMVEMFDAGRPRITRCGRRWLVVSRHGLHGQARPGDCGGPEVNLEGPPVFPRDVLLTESKGALLMLAIDLPGNEGRPDAASEDAGNAEKEEQTERERLQARLRTLEDPGEAIIAQLGDFAAVVSEIDGGLALDVVGRRDDGGGAPETARLLRMMLLGIRFAIAPAAPELDRELGDAVIEVEHDAVRATCTVSQAALIETLERDARRRQEVRDLREELQNLAGDE